MNAVTANNNVLETLERLQRENRGLGSGGARPASAEADAGESAALGRARQPARAGLHWPDGSRRRRAVRMPRGHRGARCACRRRDAVRLHPTVERWRVTDPRDPYTSKPGTLFGFFRIPGPCTRELTVIASNGTERVPWEHVSVSARRHCPTWTEMCFVKDLFWAQEEAVMQLHPPASEYVNNHPTCLHMWRPLNADIPLPPSIAVGVKEAGTLGSADARGAAMLLGLAAAMGGGGR